MNIKFIKDKKQFLNSGRNGKGKIKKIYGKVLVILLLCAMFLIGVLFGTIYIKSKMNEDFIEVKNNLLNNKELIDYEENKKDIFIESVCQNLIILILFWIIGLSIVGVPLLVFLIFFEGVSIGITISYILSYIGFWEGYKFIYVSMYITTLLNVFSMIVLCYSAIKVTFNIFRKNSDIKSEFVRHSAFCLLILIILVLSSFIEVYMGELGKNFVLV